MNNRILSVIAICLFVIVGLFLLAAVAPSALAPEEAEVVAMEVLAATETTETNVENTIVHDVELVEVCGESEYEENPHTWYLPQGEYTVRTIRGEQKTLIIEDGCWYYRQ